MKIKEEADRRGEEQDRRDVFFAKGSARIFHCYENRGFFLDRGAGGNRSLFIYNML